MRLPIITAAIIITSFSANAKSMLCHANIDDTKGLYPQQEVYSALAKCREDDAVFLRVSTTLPAEMINSLLSEGAAGQYCDFRYPVAVAVGSSLSKGTREASLRCVALGYKRDLRQ